MAWKSKEQRNQYERRWRKDNFHKANKARLKYKFKLTSDQAEKLQNMIERECCVCGNRDPRTRLCIDHDHITGSIRGVLCHRCNKVLGLVYDNAELLTQLGEYLNASKK